MSGGAHDPVLSTHDPEVASWLEELCDIEAEAAALGPVGKSLGFKETLEAWTATAFLNLCSLPWVRRGLTEAWRFELGYATAEYQQPRQRGAASAEPGAIGSRLKTSTATR